MFQALFPIIWSLRFKDYDLIWHDGFSNLMDLVKKKRLCPKTGPAIS